jgi:hypothetical protein
MSIYQAFNPRNKTWVKYKQVGDKSIILDVKENLSNIKFKGIPVRSTGKKR